MNIKHAIKQSVCTLALCGLLLTGVGCQAVSESAPILPPTRIGSSIAEASFARSFTFDEAARECDAVARIEVGNWLGENCNIHETYYEAKVLQCLKGDMPSKITLCQIGCSSSTLEAYPLFTSGNELLVFVNRAAAGDLEEYDSPYWIIGSLMTFMDVSYDNSGNRFFVDRYGFLGETVNGLSNYADQASIAREVNEYTAKKDTMAADARYLNPFIFSESDLSELIERSVN